MYSNSDFNNKRLLDVHEQSSQYVHGTLNHKIINCPRYVRGSF